YQGEIAALGREPQTTVAAQNKSERLAQAEHDVQSLESNLNQLRQKYGETWPDVITTKHLLEGAKKRRDEIAKEEVDTKKDPVSPKGLTVQAEREIRELQAKVDSLQTSIQAKQMEIDENIKNRKRSQDSMTTVQNRVDSVPLGQREYDELL